MDNNNNAGQQMFYVYNVKSPHAKYIIIIIIIG